MPVVDALGAVGALGSVAANLVSNSQNVKLARQQREHDLRMWSLNNQYNTPAAQKQRLRDAGLNAGLSMMNGMMSSGTSAQSAGGQTPATVDYNPLAQGLRESAQFFSEKRLTDAEIRNKDANTMAVNIRNKTQMVRDLAELNEIISKTGANNANKEYLIKQAAMLSKQIDAFDKKNTLENNRTEAETALLNQQEITERVMREVNAEFVRANIRVSQSQKNYIDAQTKEVLESVNQMILNGASQRQINSFIADKERETARSLRLENDNWYESYSTRIAKERSETQKNRREHRTQTFKFFGIPLGINENIEQYDENGNSKPSPLW